MPRLRDMGLRHADSEGSLAMWSMYGGSMGRPYTGDGTATTGTPTGGPGLFRLGLLSTDGGARRHSPRTTVGSTTSVTSTTGIDTATTSTITIEVGQTALPLWVLAERCHQLRYKQVHFGFSPCRQALKQYLSRRPDKQQG